MSHISILSAQRTPIGRFLGGYSSTPATTLGSIAISSAVKAAEIKKEQAQRCLMGCVLQGGLGQNPARQSALKAGLSENIDAMTINKVCGSGLESVMVLATEILAGRTTVGIAGGLENMTRAPHMSYVRAGVKYGSSEFKDHMAVDGLTCPFESWPMGNAAEHIASVFDVSRKDQDAFAVQSHERAARSSEEGFFSNEIVLCESDAIGARKPVYKDEGIRLETTMEKMQSLRPAFQKEGTVTAGNASQISDGAAALVLSSESCCTESPVLAKIVDFNTVGVSPKEIFSAPGVGIKTLLDRNNLSVKDIDLFEINEAFAAQVLANLKALDIKDQSRVNVCGGGIALGHPIGASGARVLVTLVHQMNRLDLKRGVVSLCLGGGNAVTMLIER